MQNNQNYSNRPPVDPTVTNNERSDGLPPFTAYRTGGPNPASIYAGFWKRLGAHVIDSIILLIVCFILGIILAIILTPERAENAASGVGFLITWLYFAFMEASEKQGTFGKVAMGIKVTDLQGNRISFGRATGRHFAKIISSFILCIGFIMIAFTQRKQGLHDILASTLVINRADPGANSDAFRRG